VTPLRNLNWFVAQILAALGQVDSAGLLARPVLSDSHLQALRIKNHVREPLGQLPFHIADGNNETQELLVAAFSGCIDFTFFPLPKPFVVSADHDDYTSFFAMSKSNLNRVVGRLGSAVEFVDHVPQHP
jgi:hypothetical protein